MTYSRASRCAGPAFFEDPFSKRNRRWRPCCRERFIYELPNQELEQAYLIENREAFDSFVQDNRELLSILKGASPELNRFFGPQARKVLRVVEDDEGSRTLFCLIKFEGRLLDAMGALKSFDENWWLEQCGRVAGKLNFDFELV